MDCRLEKPIAFSREARLHAEIPNTPVDTRIKDIQVCYSVRNEKLVLGQRHTSKKGNKKSKKRGSSRKGDRRGTSPGRGSSSSGNRGVEPTYNSMGGPDINLEGSVSMLSIGSVIDEFKSLMSQELAATNDSAVRDDTPSSSSSGAALSPSQRRPQTTTTPNASHPHAGSSSMSTIGIVPLRKPRKGQSYQFEEVKLYCRFPKCDKEFKHAFDLYLHSRKEHAHLQTAPFKEPYSMQSTRPNTTGSIDPFHKRPPVRSNCSGVLPALPRARPVRPDATGIVWPVEVLQQQGKWSEAIDAERLREHTNELRKVNATLTLDLKSSRFALNKGSSPSAAERRIKNLS